MVFKNLFSKLRKKKHDHSIDQANTLQSPQKNIIADELITPPHEDSNTTASQTNKKIEPTQIIYGVGYNIGKQRKKNEDSVFAQATILSTDQTELPFGIFIVADGMGGHKSGEIASEQAARTMADYIQRNLYSSLFGANPFPPNESLQEIMIEGVAAANKSVLKHAAGGGTTLTSALLLGSQLIISHIGDSRAYSIDRDGKILPLTEDHSLVQRLIQLGQITEEEAEVHPQRSMLYRALGAEDLPNADVINATMPSSGTILICSDGLWGVISEDEIYSIVNEEINPIVACQKLVDAANSAGGPDNISAILFKMTE